MTRSNLSSTLEGSGPKITATSEGARTKFRSAGVPLKLKPISMEFLLFLVERRVSWCRGWRKIIEIAMDAEKTIAEIELLERIHALPDTRTSVADREAANRMHDERHGANPWFRVWQQFGLPR